MPIYEYKCQRCACRFEVRQDFDDDPLTECRTDGCDGPVRRVFSPPAVIFKGSGFHVNDYGSRSAKAPRDQKPAETPAASDTAGSKGETD